MSKHHHHPHEGHSSGNPPGTGRQRQGPFFYLAGLFILVALICFIVLGSFAGSRSIAPPVTAATSTK
jgi:hypothetical protein